jgi:hypothetical protein
VSLIMSLFEALQGVTATQCGRTLLAVIACCFAGGGVAAQANTIVESEPFTIQAPFAANLPAQTVDVATPQFNPALGTFESGATTITGTTAIALEFFNTGAGAPYDILLSDTLSLGGIPGLFIQELTGTVPANQAAYIAAAASFPFGPVNRGDPAAAVVGSGTWDQLFSLPFPSLTINQGPGAVLPGVIVSGSSVTTYTYAPAMASVPEPRSSCLLALLFGCGFVVRKSQMRQKALLFS